MSKFLEMYNLIKNLEINIQIESINNENEV